MIETKITTLGADPEIFVKDEYDKNIPAFTFLGSKYNQPNCYWDGHQAEFIIPPAKDSEGVIKGIKNGLQTVLNAARKKNPKAKLDYRCLIDTPVEELKVLPYRFINFGCYPSNNIYTHIEALNRNINPRKVPMRVAGCHIHLGVEEFDNEKHHQWVFNKIKTLDDTVLPLCTRILNGLEDVRRRKLYGRPGEYRLKGYGIEYRTLSSTILIHPKVTKAIFDIVHKCPVGVSIQGENEDSHSWAEIDKCVDDFGWLLDAYEQGVRSMIGLDIEENWGLV
jgi:hypothetical protein